MLQASLLLLWLLQGKVMRVCYAGGATQAGSQVQWTCLQGYIATILPDSHHTGPIKTTQYQHQSGLKAWPCL